MATQKLRYTLNFGNIGVERIPFLAGKYSQQLRDKKRGPPNNIIDVEGKVKQKEEDGDLVKHEDSPKHIEVQ